jgi:hypothetical protein
VIYIGFDLEYELDIGDAMVKMKENSFTNPMKLIQGTNTYVVEYKNILFAPVSYKILLANEYSEF